MGSTVKCSRCTYRGPQDSFPVKKNLQYLQTCHACTALLAQKQLTKIESRGKEKEDIPGNRRGPAIQQLKRLTLTWEAVLILLQTHSDEAFELDVEIDLTGLEGIGELESNQKVASEIAVGVRKTTGYRFIYKCSQKSRTSDDIKTYIFFCAQLKGEETKVRLNEDVKKRRARMTMDRFNCNGWLRVTMQDGSAERANIHLRHHRAHCCYVDINVDKKTSELVESLKNMTPSKIWDEVMHKNDRTELTEKQIYQEWVRVNEKSWRLNDDQVLSAMEVVKKMEGEETEIIPIRTKEGINTIAFTFRGILEDFGNDIEEVAMDSTWKTNAKGYELYAILGEANGQGIPLAFAFTSSSDGTATEGAKDRMLQDVLDYIAKRCPNIKFTLSDKDVSEINAFRTKMPAAKHQLCYWHAIKYITERLRQDKPPAAFDPRKAHSVLSFIDPTWAPGVTSGWLEDGVHADDAEVPPPDTKTMNEHASENIADEPPPSTARPPVFILKTGDIRIPVWPNPPKMSEADRPEFCPDEYRSVITELFRVHLHRHPMIPLNRETESYQTAEEIYETSVKEIYEYCRQFDLSQVWAYLWNRWYNPTQWQLWARAACVDIPHIKTTMIVEGFWKQLKRRDLSQFNRPCLDLVTHIVMTSILPRVKRTLDYVRGTRRIGRPQALSGWQTDFKADWVNMSKSDEFQEIRKELNWLKKPAKTPGRAERLAEIEERRGQAHGTYHTNLIKWTCSCPSYLISRFLLCKHIVRQANTILEDWPLTDLRFFLNLRRQHLTPFYIIPGIHESHSLDSGNNEDDEEETEILLLGHGLKRYRSTSEISSVCLASSFSGSPERASSPSREEDEKDHNEQRTRAGKMEWIVDDDDDDEEVESEKRVSKFFVDQPYGDSVEILT